MIGNELGDYGEQLATLRALELGFEVFQPISKRSSIDMILLKDNTTYRVQVKCYNNNGESIEINCRNTFSYTKENTDVIIFVDPNTKLCYWIDVFWQKPRCRFVLRFAPTKNNQTQGVNLAEEYLW